MDESEDGRFLVTDNNLGQGGQAQVLRGIEMKSDTVVAVRRISFDDYSRKEYYKREVENYRRLTATAQQWECPYLAKYVGASKDKQGSYGFLVTELVEGPTLYDFLTRQKVSEDTAKRWLCQLAQAVCFLHSCDIVHRDLTPGNVMLTKDGIDADIKLIDMGASKFYRKEDSSDLQIPRSNIGTEEYKAPEVDGHSEYGKEVDIWGLGLLFLVMLTKPLNSSSEKVQFLSDLETRRSVSGETLALLKCMLCHSPSDRIQMSELLRRLNLRLQPDPTKPNVYRDMLTIKLVKAIKYPLSCKADPVYEVFQSSQKLRKTHHFGSVFWPNEVIDQGEFRYFIFDLFECQTLDLYIQSEVCIYEGTARALLQTLFAGLLELNRAGLTLIPNFGPADILLIKESEVACFIDFTSVRRADSEDCYRAGVARLGRVLAFAVLGTRSVLSVAALNLMSNLMRTNRKCLSERCCTFLWKVLLSTDSLEQILRDPFLQAIKVDTEQELSQESLCEKQAGRFLSMGQNLAEVTLRHGKLVEHYSVLVLLLRCVQCIRPQASACLTLSNAADQIGNWIKQYASSEAEALVKPVECIFKCCEIERRKGSNRMRQLKDLAGFLCKSFIYEQTDRATFIRQVQLYNCI